MQTTVIIAACLFVTLGSAAQTTLHVAQNGKDQNDGSEKAPFATLEKARDTIRQLRRDGKLTTLAAVEIKGDLYLAKSFVLEASDSGEKNHPITYRAQPGESARLIGGRAVQQFGPVEEKETLSLLDPSARPHVLVADLKAQGITDFGELKVRGMRNQADAALELFFDGQPMQLAQYPNEGWLTIATTPAGAEGDQITCDSARLARWQQATDAWAYGYWYWGWADTYLPVKSVEPQTKVIQLGAKPYYGLKPQQRFRLLNLLEELDQPGEWYLDRKAGMLYFWPPKPPASGIVLVSVLTTPVIQTVNASNIRLEGLVVEATRSQGIAVQDGDHVVIAGCTVRNVGANGITVKGGNSHEVISSDIHDCGEGGIVLSGGDRETLTAGSHAAVNNHIRNIGRTYHTYRPAISLSGVGNRASNNLIHDCPHQAFEYIGNDLVMEFNEIHHVLLETDDAGAIYGGRDWTKRGNIIRGNYIYHSGPDHAPAAKPVTDPSVVTSPLHVEGIMPVYLDDLNSGALVENNILEGGRISVLLGGGRDNIVQNNVFIDAKYGIWLDARGLTWNREVCSPGGSHRLYEMLSEVKPDQPPYSTRYPELANLLYDEPQKPKGNQIRRNILINIPTAAYAHDDIAKVLLSAQGMLALEIPTPVQPVAILKNVTDTQMQSIGFTPIPTAKIGLFKDAYRTTAPEKEQPLTPAH